MTKKTRSQVQVSKARFLRRIEGVTLFDKVCSFEIQKSLTIVSLLLKQTLLAKVKGKRPVDDRYTLAELYVRCWMESLGSLGDSPKRNDGSGGEP